FCPNVSVVRMCSRRSACVRTLQRVPQKVHSLLQYRDTSFRIRDRTTRLAQLNRVNRGLRRGRADGCANGRGRGRRAADDELGLEEELLARDVVPGDLAQELADRSL